MFFCDGSCISFAYSHFTGCHRHRMLPMFLLRQLQFFYLSAFIEQYFVAIGIGMFRSRFIRMNLHFKASLHLLSNDCRQFHCMMYEEHTEISFDYCRLDRTDILSVLSRYSVHIQISLLNCSLVRPSDLIVRYESFKSSFVSGCACVDGYRYITTCQRCIQWLINFHCLRSQSTLQPFYV